MLLHISYKDHVTNEDVSRKIQVATGEYGELTMVKKQKPRWFSNISSSSGLAKTILQGTVKGKRRGKQKKRWMTILRSEPGWTLQAQLGQPTQD